MDKHELTRRIARRTRQSQGSAADKVDALVYELWKETSTPAQVVSAVLPAIKAVKPELSSAPVKES